MKKLIPAIFLLLSIGLFAQEKDASRTNMKEQEMATLKAQRLGMQLDLNEDQKKNLEKLYASYQESLNELKREEPEENNQKIDQRQEVEEEFQSELREILTKEQYAKWEQLQEKRRKGRRDPMRERQK